MQHTRRWRRWVLLGGAMFGASLAWLALTSAGARLLLDEAARRAGIELHYGTFRGDLLRGLDIADVALRAPGMTLTLETVRVRWDPWTLWRGDLVFTHAALHRGTLQVTAAGASAAGGLPRVPLAVDVASLDVREFALVIGSTRHHVAAFATRARITRDTLELGPFDLALAAHRLRGHLRVDIRDGSLTGEVEYAGEIDGTPIAARMRAHGPWSAVQAVLQVRAPFAARLAGVLDLAGRAPRLDVQGEALPQPWLAAHGSPAELAAVRLALAGTWPELTLRATTDVRLAAGPSVEVTLAGTRLPDAPAGPRAMLTWSVIPDSPRFGIGEIAGGGEVGWDGRQLTLQQHLHAPSPLELTGTIAPGPAPEVSLAATWESLALAVAGTTVQSPRGRLTIEGRYPALACAFEGRVSAAPVGAVDAHARMDLDTDRVTLDHLTASLLGGTLTARGALDSLASRTGTFTVIARDLDLAHVRPGLATRVSLHGTATLAGSRVQFALDDARGRWRGQTLAAAGGIVLSEEGIGVQDLALRIGRNRADVDGTITPALALAARLDLPVLSDLDASFAGALRGEARVHGTLASPLPDADLVVSALRAGGFSVDEAHLVAATAPGGSSTATLSARAARLGAVTWDTLRLDARGTAAAHTIRLAAAGDGHDLTLRFRGRWREQALDGTLEAFSFTWPEAGRWRLAAAAPYRYARGAWSFDALCFTQDAARACAEAHALAATQGRLELDLTRIPAALARPWLPDGVSLVGAFDGEIAATRQAAGWLPEGTLTGRGVALELAAGTPAAMALPLQPFALRTQPRGAARAFEFEVANADLGALHAAGELRATGNALGVDARLRLDSAELSTLAARMPILAGSTGRIALSAHVHGALPTPRVHAEAQLRDGELRFDEAGIGFDRVRLVVTGPADGRLDMKGEIGQGAQRLNVTGTLPTQLAQAFDLRFSSAGFTAIRRPELVADIVPDLRIDGTLAAPHLHGTVEIPRLALQLSQLPPQAVTVSPDEVLLDAQGNVVTDAPKSAAWRFYHERLRAALTVNLGDAARVEGLGLKARLSGGLRLLKDPGSPGLAHGRIALVDGRYVAYRQPLSLVRGELQFAGPADNPALDVLALRPGIDVKAGVTIGGTVQTPVVRLYAAPPMNDLETLSWVITGQPLQGTDRGRASLLAKAALGLGVEQASGLTDQLRQWFALDELGVGGGETVRDTMLVAGKQLSPRLRVRSEFNPFDQLWAVFVRYQLTPEWSVEGESGARQGADLIYSIEREALF